MALRPQTTYTGSFYAKGDAGRDGEPGERCDGQDRGNGDGDGRGDRVEAILSSR